MIRNEEDTKYKEIINTLHSLQQVKAPAGFEADLMRRINSDRVKTRQSFFESLLLPSRLIPSSAAVLAIVIFLIFFNTQSSQTGNPFMESPRVREDLGVTRVPVLQQTTVLEKQTDNETDNLSAEPLEKFKEPEKKSTPPGIEYTASASNSGLIISKSGLNFRQINLTAEERAELDRLKAKIKAFWGSPARK